ncbi:hypothetical protein D3C83_147580 [compost metagenome]
MPAGSRVMNHGPSEVASTSIVPAASAMATLTSLTYEPEFRANTSLRLKLPARVLRCSIESVPTPPDT